MDPRADGGSADDRELLQRLAQRPGDTDAYATLWQRHAGAARRLGSHLVRAADVDDLVSEAFLRVLRVVRRGEGPQTAFRSYLFQTMRRLAVDTSRSYYSRVDLVPNTDVGESPVPSAGDVYLTRVDAHAAWAAWRSLPEASRAVLWHVVVDEQTPRALAKQFGVTANSVAKRASRAREELRVAFLDQHVARTADDAACRAVAGSLAAHVRHRLGPRERARVRRHLRSCERCPQVVAELRDINATIRVVVAPLLLGGAGVAATWLGGAAHRSAVASFGVRRAGTGWALTHPVAAGVATATAALATGAVLVFVPGSGAPGRPAGAARQQPRAVVPTVPTDAPVAPHRRGGPHPIATARPEDPLGDLHPRVSLPTATPTATPIRTPAPTPAATSWPAPPTATSSSTSAPSSAPVPPGSPAPEMMRARTVRVPTPHERAARVHLRLPAGWGIASVAANGVVRMYPRRPRAMTLVVDAPFVDLDLSHTGAGGGPARMRVAVITDGTASVSWVTLG